MSPEPQDLNPGIGTRRALRKLEIATRRKQVAQLLREKVPQYEIAATLKVSVGTVSSDLKSLRQIWNEEAQVALEAHIAQELFINNEDERMLRQDMRNAGRDIELKMRIFDRVLKVQEARRKLLGLDAPIRMELARAEARKLAEEFGLDADDIIALAEDIVMGKRR